MRTVPELLICLRSLISNSMQKNKSIILSGVLEILCPFLVLTYMKPDELSLVVCPASWIPAFLQPTKKGFWGEKYSSSACLMPFFFSTWFEANGLWKCSVFHMNLFPDWWLFRPGSFSLRSSSVLNKSTGYWFMPETPFSPFTWLQSPAWQGQCPTEEWDMEMVVPHLSQPSCWCAITVVVVLSSILFPLYWLVWCFFGVLLGDDCMQNKCLLLKIKVLFFSGNFTKEEKQSEVFLRTSFSSCRRFFPWLSYLFIFF